MKRDFLKNLGVEDKEIIDKILDENSSDIGKAKGDLEGYKNQIDELTEQIKSRDSQLGELKKLTENNEELTAKITKLQEDNTKFSTEYQTKLVEIQKAHAIENCLRDCKAKNIKAVTALLDMEKITYENGELFGLKEQLTTLQKNEDSGFLFESAEPTVPKGTEPNTPPAGSGTPPTSNSLAEAIGKAFQSN